LSPCRYKNESRETGWRPPRLWLNHTAIASIEQPSRRYAHATIRLKDGTAYQIEDAAVWFDAVREAETDRV
jgi:hypothetical protein